jgi:hypothetical protein
MQEYIQLLGDSPTQECEIFVITWWITFDDLTFQFDYIFI